MHTGEIDATIIPSLHIKTAISAVIQWLYWHENLKKQTSQSIKAHLSSELIFIFSGSLERLQTEEEVQKPEAVPERPQ